VCCLPTDLGVTALEHCIARVILHIIVIVTHDILQPQREKVSMCVYVCVCERERGRSKKLPLPEPNALDQINLAISRF
jgi:hypothetical protein